MTGGWTAENACKQVLSSLKKSNLHFVLRETPFSAQVIIKKKFVKLFQTSASQNENVPKIDNLPIVKKGDKENSFLQQK